MTGIEDTYRTLTAILFQVEANNSSKIFAITNIQEKICRVSVPVGSIIPRVDQGIIDMNRNGNSANFFSYVCNSKKSKELFSSTLDRISISVKCVSSMKVVYESRRSPTLSAAFC